MNNNKKKKSFILITKPFRTGLQNFFEIVFLLPGRKLHSSFRKMISLIFVLLYSMFHQNTIEMEKNPLHDILRLHCLLLQRLQLKIFWHIKMQTLTQEVLNAYLNDNIDKLLVLEKKFDV